MLIYSRIVKVRSPNIISLAEMSLVNPPLDIVGTAINVRSNNSPETCSKINGLAVASPALVANGGGVGHAVVQDCDLLAAPWVSVGLLTHHTVSKSNRQISVLDGPTTGSATSSGVVVSNVPEVVVGWYTASSGYSSDS